MWIMVLYDLPVLTKKERRAAGKFRERLLDMGFQPSQLSVYLKFCPSRERADAVAKKVGTFVPPGGQVQILQFTDKQYENLICYHGRTKADSWKNPEQFELF